MISVEEALLIAEGRSQQLVGTDEFLLTDREHTQLEYLDATLEAGVHRSFSGAPFDFRVPSSMVPNEKVIEALKQRWELAGWQVGLFFVLAKNDRTNEIEQHYQLILACPERVEANKSKEIIEKLEPAPKVLPTIIVGPVSLEPADLRLLVRMPTRNRPEQAVWVLEKYRRMAGIPIQIEVVVDEDDESMRRAEVVQRLAALDCAITVGRHKSKIEACNGGRVSEWDILMLASDDMVPLQEGYAKTIVEAMKEHWPHLDGALSFNDGHQRPDSLGVPLCTLPILGRRFYEQFGYVYAPEYKSLFVDREQTDLFHAMGRLKYVDEQLIEHRHHIWGRAEKDALYERNDALESEDRKTYERRREIKREYAQWGFDSPVLWLSVLVCTVPKRRAQLEWLLRHLWVQILGHQGVSGPVHASQPASGEFVVSGTRNDPREIEVLVDSRESVTVGAKRQALLERARGRYVAFIDDDDGVASDYIQRVISALKAQPDADCASLEGVITENGVNPQRFTHSIVNKEWYTKNGTHFRNSNHLNAIRREIALKVGFIGKNVGEDFEFSKRIQPLLKKEVSTGSAVLYMYWFNAAQSVQVKR